MNPWRATIWSVNLLLVGAIAYAAAITTSHVVERSLSTAPAPAQAERKPPVKSAKRSDVPLSAYQEVLDRNIFGARRSSVRPVAAVQSDAPAVSPFHVTLTGTFLAGDDSFAMVIGQGEREERLYRVGDCLPAVDGQNDGKCQGSQAKLAKIELDRIVVLKGGQRIPVEIGKGPAGEPRRVAEAPAKAKRETARNRLTRSRGRTARIPTTATTEEAAPQEEEEAEEQSNEFPAERVGNTYQVTVPNAEVEKAFENFSEIAGQAAAVPIIQDGEAQGFQLRKIRPGSIFERLGLRNNDLIRGVNGKSITTADEALRVFTLFRNEREIVLDVKRRDEDLKFAYTVE